MQEFQNWLMIKLVPSFKLRTRHLQLYYPQLCSYYTIQNFKDFQMRYCPSVWLKGVQKYWRSKLEVWKNFDSTLTFYCTRAGVRELFSSFFGPPTLTSSSFAATALWAKQILFESCHNFWMDYYLVKSIMASLRSDISIQSILIYVVLIW